MYGENKESDLLEGYKLDKTMEGQNNLQNPVHCYIF